MRIPVKYRTVLFCLFMSFFMSMTISLCLTLISGGVSVATLGIWPSRFALSFAIAFPVSLSVVPIVHRIVGRICI